MTEQKTGKPFQAVHQPPRPASINHARRARELLPQGGVDLRHVKFSAGEVLVRDGTVAQDGMAYFVLEGILREEQDFRHPDKGLVVRTLYDVTPGEIAYHQALLQEHAEKPARTRVVAVTSGEAVFITLEDLAFGKQAQRLIEDLDRKLQHALEAHDQGHDDDAKAFFDMLAGLAAHARKLYGDHATPRDILNGIHRQMRQNEELQRQAAETERERASLAVDLAHAKHENADLNRRYGEAILVGVTSRQTMKEAVTMIEDERRLMQMRALGSEIYFDRIREVWSRAGLDTHALDFTPDEAELLLGGTPEGVETIRHRVSAKRAVQWDEDEIDAALELGIQPSSPTARLINAGSSPSVHGMPASRASRPKMQTLDLPDAAALREEAERLARARFSQYEPAASQDPEVSVTGEEEITSTVYRLTANNPPDIDFDPPTLPALRRKDQSGQERPKK